MGIIRFAINNPVKVTVGVILLTLFGVLSVFAIPIQLIPNVDEPQITVQTFWEGVKVVVRGNEQLMPFPAKMVVVEEEALMTTSTESSDLQPARTSSH